MRVDPVTSLHDNLMFYFLFFGCFGSPLLFTGFPLDTESGAYSLVVVWGFSLWWLLMNCGFDLWVGKISWRRKWQPIPIFLSGKSHGQRSPVGCSSWVARVRQDLATTPPPPSLVEHRHTASVVAAGMLSSCGPWLNRTEACGIFPDQGSNPCPLALAGRFLSTIPPGKFTCFYFRVRDSLLTLCFPNLPDRNLTGASYDFYDERKLGKWLKTFATQSVDQGPTSITPGSLLELQNLLLPKTSWGRTSALTNSPVDCRHLEIWKALT